MKYLLIICCFSLYFSPLIGQKKYLFESKEYKEAYQKGTRSRTGLPGENYWQNRSEYLIKATFQPTNHVISGNLKITYFNESPDSLDRVVFKLMQNLYQKGAVRQMAVDSKILHDGVEISNVKVDNQELDKNSIAISGTVMRLMLPSSIKSKTSKTIALDFVTPIPKKAGFRGGTVDSTSFFMAYWFPQVAVYDDVFGWDTDEYVGIPENYNDFSHYDVEITLPSQYNVWATGRHMNAREIFLGEILTRIAESKISKKPVMILDEADFRQPDGRSNTWKFKAENVPDFAWATSDHYLWEGMAASNPEPSNLCWVQTAYAKDHPNFDWVLEVAKNSVEVFSLGFPGVAYPYSKHISFSGTEGGGMEFPMLANNHATPDSTSTIMVTAHELAHNYYPFMMGINERKYGWWDETMTTLMETYISEKAYSRHKVQGIFNRKFSFPYFSPLHEMQPLMTETSSIMKVMPSIVNFYIKGPAIMDGLANLIGTEKFYQYNKDFMGVWKGKHPTPYDFFYFINHQKEKNLNWFWDASFFAKAYPDLAVKSAIQYTSYIAVSIQNVGKLPVPLQLTITYEDGTQVDETFSIDVWEENLEEVTLRVPSSKKVEKVTLNQTYHYDSNPTNNEVVVRP